MDDRLLGIDLNDQLAAGVLWRETARCARRNDSDGDVDEALARVTTAISEPLHRAGHRGQEGPVGDPA